MTPKPVTVSAVARVTADRWRCVFRGRVDVSGRLDLPRLSPRGRSALHRSPGSRSASDGAGGSPRSRPAAVSLADAEAGEADVTTRLVVLRLTQARSAAASPRRRSCPPGHRPARRCRSSPRPSTGRRPPRSHPPGGRTPLCPGPTTRRLEVRIRSTNSSTSASSRSSGTALLTRPHSTAVGRIDPVTGEQHLHGALSSDGSGERDHRRRAEQPDLHPGGGEPRRLGRNARSQLATS